MREFIYFSSKAHTSGNFNDLMEAGRMDIVCHTLIAAFFFSHNIRQDVKLHLIFAGPPDPCKHLIFEYNKDIPISKKDVAGLIKRMLYKYKPGKLAEVFPGCKIEKKAFQTLIKELESENKKIYLLDEKGEDIRQLEYDGLKDGVFIIGDHEGLKKGELKFIKSRKEIKKISVGPLTLFASQTMVILNNELDRREV